jgi:hypothetical protein
VPCGDRHVALTRGSLLRLAQVCDRLGDQATTDQLAAMAANRRGYDQDHQELMRATTVHFLEWLEPRWRSTPVSRGEMIRSMVNLQDQGLLDEMFNPTPGGWQTIDEIKDEQRPRPRSVPDQPDH